MKYSILIPTYNAGVYIEPCLQTILEQDYDDVEILISDDHSTDETYAYLQSLQDPRVKVFSPPYEMSMTEHWEWLLDKAQGEWLMYVGQDDGLQGYFFELADILTEKTKGLGLRCIASSRAYYFWEGCEELYGSRGVHYKATALVQTKSTVWNAFLALCGHHDYFELPQMYTTSLFHRSLIEEVKQLNDGSFFTTHPQDANLAALACSLEKSYLFSFIPLGWVGSSPKSAGFSVSSKGNEELKKVYISKISKSKLLCHDIIGDFSTCSGWLYFYGAMLKTLPFNRTWLGKYIKKATFKNMVFAADLLYCQQNICNEAVMQEKIVHIQKYGGNMATIQMYSVFFKVLQKCTVFTLAYRGLKKWRKNISYIQDSEQRQKLTIENEKVKMLLQQANILATVKK